MSAVLDQEVEVTQGRAPGRAWFCLRTHHNLEHVAAAHLRQFFGLEVFLPRIRYRRLTRIGPKWKTEPLFRNYVFAKFDLTTHLRPVQHARAVREIVHFGCRWPRIPETVIAELRNALGNEDIRELPDEFQAGDSVCLATGALKGLEAVVTHVLPGPRRVMVLLEFLGRLTQVELSTEQVVRQELRLIPDGIAIAQFA